MNGHAGGRRGSFAGSRRCLFAGVLSGLQGWLRPGAEVFGAGVPGQEAFQCCPGEGFAAVAAAFVEVSGEPGQGVEAGHLDGCGDGPDRGGEQGGVVIMGAAGVFPGHDGTADHPLGLVVVLIRNSA